MSQPLASLSIASLQAGFCWGLTCDLGESLVQSTQCEPDSSNGDGARVRATHESTSGIFGYS